MQVQRTELNWEITTWVCFFICFSTPFPVKCLTTRMRIQGNQVSTVGSFKISAHDRLLRGFTNNWHGRRRRVSFTTQITHSKARKCMADPMSGSKSSASPSGCYWFVVHEHEMYQVQKWYRSIPNRILSSSHTREFSHGCEWNMRKSQVVSIFHLPPEVDILRSQNLEGWNWINSFYAIIKIIPIWAFFLCFSRYFSKIFN